MNAAMGWIREADTTPEHRKVLALSDRAFRLWHHAKCYCSRNLTDGVVPGYHLVALSRSANMRTVAELVGVGLLEHDGDDYRVHDYLDYNPSREHVEGQRTATRRRVASWRSRQDGTSERDDNAVTPPERNGPVTALVTPTRDRERTGQDEVRINAGEQQLVDARARASGQAATILSVMWPGASAALVENVASMYPAVDIAQAARLAVAWASDETWNTRGAGATLRAAARKLDAERAASTTTNAVADERRATDERRWAAARDIYGEDK